MMEQLVAEFGCTLLTQSGRLPGFMQISSFHLCFVGENSLAVALRLPDIASLQLALTIPPPTPKAPPHVALVYDPSWQTTEASCVEVFTAAGQWLLFGEFWSLTSDANLVMDAFATLDGCWRDVPGWKPPEQSLGYGHFEHPQLEAYVAPEEPEGS